MLLLQSRDVECGDVVWIVIEVTNELFPFI